MNSFFYEVFVFVGYCWFINISLNILGTINLKFPSLEKLDKPFDCGIVLPDGNRLLGESTTWGGLVLALVLGSLFAYVYPGNYFLVKALCVFFGHATGSFIKRRLGMPRGAYLPIINHGDHIILTGIVSIYLEILSIQAFLVALLITLVVTPLVTMSFYKLGLRDNRL